MDYWWKENRKFALAVGGGVLGLAAWALFVVGPINASADKARQDLTNQRLMLQGRLAAGVPAEDSVGRAERDRKALTEDLKSLQAAAEFKLEEAFKGSDGSKTPQELLGRARGDLVKLLDLKCKERGFPQIAQNLGMPSSVQTLPDPVATEWLKRLAILKRVCLLAIEHAEKLELVEVVPNPNQDESLIQDARFMNKLTLKFRVQAPAEGTLRLVHALQQKGTFLAVEAFSTGLADAGRDLMSTELSVCGIFANLSGGVMPEHKE